MREVLDVMQMLGLQSGGLATRDAMLALTPEQAVRTEDDRRTQMKKEKEVNSMKKIDTLTIAEKVEIIKETVPTFTVDKAMNCTMIELNDLLVKVIAYTHAKADLELMVVCQGY